MLESVCSFLLSETRRSRGEKKRLVYAHARDQYVTIARFQAITSEIRRELPSIVHNLHQETLSSTKRGFTAIRKDAFRCWYSSRLHRGLVVAACPTFCRAFTLSLYEALKNIFAVNGEVTRVYLRKRLGLILCNRRGGVMSAFQICEGQYTIVLWK